MPLLTAACSEARSGLQSKAPRQKKTARRQGSSRWGQDPQVKLMLQVQQGDEDAFRELVDFYTPRVFGYFVRLVRDRAEAEDLTQEVFLRLYRYRERYQPRASFNTWVFHITQNVARNALRTRRRRHWIPLDMSQAHESGLADAILTDPFSSPTAHVERAELARVVREAVNELAGRQRLAVELHQLEGQTYVEVAARMDMSPKAAKSLLYRARTQLRAALTPFVQ